MRHIFVIVSFALFPWKLSDYRIISLYRVHLYQLQLGGFIDERLFANKPPPIYLNSEYTCIIDDLQWFSYSVLPYKVMHMTVFGHITKYHEGNTCLSHHSSSPHSVRGSFISSRGRRFEYMPPGLINELKLFYLNSQKGTFSFISPGA